MSKKKSRERLTDRVRNSVLKRDKHKCVECGYKEGLHVHHKLHRKDGGTDDMENLETLCELCHAEKHRDEPVYNIMVKSLFQYVDL